ncbi:fluoride efflux transporter FluC [Brevibacterium samyangense]|uniref:Fluoride-specific ion channel FluC n=1 Tax=Brevibacterium samyangense TaxID=366888 RepID=A0ABN2THD9_9MICO
MTDLTLLVVLAGGFGASARYLLDRFVTALFGFPVWPVGVLVVNVLGAFGAGAVSQAPEAWVAVAGTGFLGAFSTFSTVFVDAVRLYTAGHRRKGILSVAVTLAAITLAAWLGVLLAQGIAAINAGALG